MPTTSGKRTFRELLNQEGLTVLFGNPGTTELPLMDALAAEDQLRSVLARSLGVEARHITHLADLTATLPAALTASQAILFDVVVDGSLAPV